jgi:hypothetical protein
VRVRGVLEVERWSHWDIGGWSRWLTAMTV